MAAITEKVMITFDGGSMTLSGPKKAMSKTKQEACTQVVMLYMREILPVHEALSLTAFACISTCTGIMKSNISNNTAILHQNKKDMERYYYLLNKIGVNKFNQLLHAYLPHSSPRKLKDGQLPLTESCYLSLASETEDDEIIELCTLGESFVQINTLVTAEPDCQSTMSTLKTALTQALDVLQACQMRLKEYTSLAQLSITNLQPVDKLTTLTVRIEREMLEMNSFSFSFHRILSSCITNYKDYHAEFTQVQKCIGFCERSFESITRFEQSLKPVFKVESA